MIAEKLRKSILQAAIQGKLTQQLPEDGDARDLLKEIRAKKDRLIKEGKIKKEKPLPEITEDEIPFDIPDNWCWVRLGDYCEKVTDYVASGSFESLRKNAPSLKNNGYALLVKTADFANGFTRNLTYTDEVGYNFLRNSNLFGGELILSNIGASIGKIFIVPKLEFKMTLAPNSIMLRFTDEEKYVRYVFYLFQSQYGYSLLKSISFGSATPKFSKTDLKKLIIPIPPFHEQLRIVHEIENALGKITDLMKEEKELIDLQKSFPKKMKDSILQAAIQGKLTEQLPEDGDARDLLKEIRAEKERLIKEGKIKKEKPLPEITEDEIPFDIPDNWCWVRLGEISQYIQRGKSPKYSTIKRYPVIAQKCNQWSGFSIEKAQFIDPDTVPRYSEERILQEEDLLWNSTGLGTLGRMAIYFSADNPYGFAVADSHVTVIRTLKNKVQPKYIFAFISGPYVQSIVENISSGSTKQKELLAETIKNLLIPLPPLAAQQRILAKLNSVLSLCATLE